MQELLLGVQLQPVSLHSLTTAGGQSLWATNLEHCVQDELEGALIAEHVLGYTSLVKQVLPLWTQLLHLMWMQGILITQPVSSAGRTNCSGGLIMP